MSSDSGFSEKMDAIDLIVTALKDHEKRLDTLSRRLESICKSLSIYEVYEKIEVEKKEEKRAEPSPARKGPSVICNNWNEFRAVSRGAKTVAFEIERNLFHVYSMVNEDVFRYSEDLPVEKLRVVEEESSFSIDKAYLINIDLLEFLIQGKLKCGLSLSIKSLRTALSDKQYLFELSYDFDPNEVKVFLSRELSTSKSNIVEGKINY